MQNFPQYFNLFVLVPFFVLVAVIKYPDKKELKEKGYILVHSSVLVHFYEEVIESGALDSWFHQTQTQEQRERNASMLSVLSSSFPLI